MAKQGNEVFLPGLQILRGIAALAVVCHHILEEGRSLPLLSAIPSSLVLLGASGVDIFFVISGFIMLYTTAGKVGQPSAARRFMLNRILRVAPLYWLVTIAVLLGKGLGFYQHKIVAASSVLASLLFIYTPNIIVGVGWTLNYEMYFYLLFAFGLLFCSLSDVSICGESFVFRVRGLVLFVNAVLLAGLLTPSFLAQRIVLEFCYGLWLAFFFARTKPSCRLSLAMLVLGLAGMLCASIFAPHTTTAGLDDDWRFIAWGLPATCLVLSSLRVVSIGSLPGRFFLQIGDASYSLYLTPLPYHDRLWASAENRHAEPSVASRLRASLFLCGCRFVDLSLCRKAIRSISEKPGRQALKNLSSTNFSSTRQCAKVRAAAT